MRIVSIQSAVAYGHVGNSAALFPLQRMGHEVWPVDTVQFSNHPGHGHWSGQVLPAAHVRQVIEGMAALGALAACDGVLSGYLGEAGTADAVAAAVEAVKAANPRALYLCDPVMGDEGPGLYVRPGIPEAMRDRLLPMADIVTPNRFELELLSLRPAATIAQAIDAARSLLAKGPRVVIVTSLPDPADPDTIACLAVTTEGSWVVRTPLLVLDPPVNGAGDMLAALVLGHALNGASPSQALAGETPAQALAGETPARALSLAVSTLFGVLRQTRGRELAIVQAQDEIVSPSQLFAPRELPP